MTKLSRFSHSVSRSPYRYFSIYFPRRLRILWMLHYDVEPSLSVRQLAWHVRLDLQQGDTTRTLLARRQSIGTFDVSLAEFRPT